MADNIYLPDLYFCKVWDNHYTYNRGYWFMPNYQILGVYNHGLN